MASQLDLCPNPVYPNLVKKERLDVLLYQRGLTESRERARRLIMAAQVMVNGAVVDKPGTRVAADAEIVLKERLRYASRGGLKLEAALDDLTVDVAGKVAADIGASTGGFTDCLLQRGAKRVYAIDVGYGQLAWPLRQDPRVVVLDRVNARHLRELAEPVDLITVDVSFISLKLVLPAARELLKPQGQIIALIKPQFEAGRNKVGKGGVVKDSAVHREVLHDILYWALDNGFHVLGVTGSPIRGPAGNVEFFAHLEASEMPAEAPIDEWVEAVLASVPPE
jgi:23S rRNA (cytidine1920-2'-O)/16S rRNA (cytidine1409-2'-O)-methyltransferase